MSKGIRIALIGYGKMGKAIEEIALQRGHSVVLKIDEFNTADYTRENLSKTDVAIEFTGPHSAYANVKNAIDWQTPIVCGSTGWTERLDELKKYCQEKNGSFIYASNFSIGVNIFFELNKKLASLMSPHTNYTVSLEEIHHTQKKDAPSGTAISLAEQVMEQLPSKKKWVNKESNDPAELSIMSKRIDAAAGTHIVKYTSLIDDIEIIHTAHNRMGFAAGAVLAAEFLKGKKGYFGMKEVLNL
jgi:4-hydroxy-tetrahydrodipicolinate reductase